MPALRFSRPQRMMGRHARVPSPTPQRRASDLPRLAFAAGDVTKDIADGNHPEAGLRSWWTGGGARPKTRR